MPRKVQRTNGDGFHGEKSVCLVLPPYAPLERPSLAMGLLKAGLAEKKIAASVIYANILFAGEIGACDYAAIDQFPREFQCGEWTFRDAAFRNDPEMDRKYADFINGYNRSAESAGIVPLIFSVRKKVAPFLEKLVGEIIAKKPFILGISSSFQQNCAALSIARMVRERDPDIVTVLGGANCEGAMGISLLKKFEFIDYVFSGESDHIFPEFCETLISGDNKKLNFPATSGIICRKNLAEIDSLKTPPRAFCLSMENIPTPDFDDYFRAISNSAEVSLIIEPGIVFETSRGCVKGNNKCNFCGLNGDNSGYRVKSADKSFAELKSISEKYGINKFEMVDNSLCYTKMKDFFEKLSRANFPYSIFYETRTNVSRKVVGALSRAGIKWTQPGVESLHDGLLSALNKGVSAIDNISFLKNARENGIRVSWNLLYDIPGEVDEWYGEMASTIQLIHHLQPPGRIYKIHFDRFSPYHENPGKFGINISPINAFSFIYPFSSDEINDFAYFFEKKETKGRSDFRKACLNSATNWLNLFWSVNRPMLNAEETTDALIVTDMRPCAVTRKHRLTGLPRMIHDLCRDPESFEDISAAAKKYPKVEIEKAITSLKDNKLLLEIGGQLLSLAVYGKCPPLTEDRDIPGGYVDYVKVRKEYIKTYLKKDKADAEN